MNKPNNNEPGNSRLITPADVLHYGLKTDLFTFTAKVFQTVSPGSQFKANWHLYAIAYALERCRLGKCRRLIITIPPRNLKSISVSVAFVAWLLAKDPTTRAVVASYSQDLSNKHARDTKAVMESEWYQKLFPRTRINPKKNAVQEFETTRKGGRLATSVGGTVTGRGGDFLIVDDPLKPDEADSEAARNTANDWFSNTLFTRLDDKKNGVVIVIMQRLHQDDPVGRLLRTQDWEWVNLPAEAQADIRVPISEDQDYLFKAGEILHPEREGKKELDELKETMGWRIYSAQYLQEPAPKDGAIVKWSWFQTYETEPRRAGNDMIVQSWDTASKATELSNYSVCTTWLKRKCEGGEKYCLLDVFRKRMEYPELRKAVMDQHNRWRPNVVLIEDKASGQQLIQEYRRTSMRVIPIKPEQDKVTRMSNQSALIESGKVYLPKEAPWLDDLRYELTAFPGSRHDDQVDSVSQFLKWAFDKSRSIVGSGRHIGMF